MVHTDITALFLVFTSAVLLARSRNLFAVTIMSGIFSVLCALTYLIMYAPDVALTEAAVGACASTCIILAALRLFKEESVNSKTSVINVFVFLGLFVALSYVTLNIHSYGDPNAITNNGPVAYYKQNAGHDIGLMSIVNAILASYRGFDTFGETLVIFVAGVCVMLILGKTKRQS